MGAINYFTEEVDFKIPRPRKTTTWLKASIVTEGKNLGLINFIFCSDNYLHNINIQFLNHSDLTDIITFDQNESQNDDIIGDIYISIERVKENSNTYGVTFEDEINRVMIHGVLHLIGYFDKSKSEKKLMREKEDAYLSLRNKQFHVKPQTYSI